MADEQEGLRCMGCQLRQRRHGLCWGLQELSKRFKKNLIMLAKAFICYVTERAILASRALSLCVLNVACKFEAKHVISRQCVLSKMPTEKSQGDRVETCV